jgi:hypothetical protein
MNLLNPGKTPQTTFRSSSLSRRSSTRSTPTPRSQAFRRQRGQRPPPRSERGPSRDHLDFPRRQLQDIFEGIATGRPVPSNEGHKLELGVNTLPKLPKDLTDRNRTSPFAFTGNKFEFRMVPSSDSISGPNFVLNTIVAEVLSAFATKLEGAKDLTAAIKEIVTDTWKKHSRVVFNGNGYTEDWVKEAAKRGLPNLKSSVEAWRITAGEFGPNLPSTRCSAGRNPARLDIVPRNIQAD